jgi:hypothetical protein
MRSSTTRLGEKTQSDWLELRNPPAHSGWGQTAYHRPGETSATACGRRGVPRRHVSRRQPARRSVTPPRMTRVRRRVDRDAAYRVRLDVHLDHFAVEDRQARRIRAHRWPARHRSTEAQLPREPAHAPPSTSADDCCEGCGRPFGAGLMPFIVSVISDPSRQATAWRVGPRTPGSRQSRVTLSAGISGVADMPQDCLTWRLNIGRLEMQKRRPGR